MPAPLRIRLTEEEDRTLRELSYASGVPQRVKQRATALRLNAADWKVEQIAAHLDWQAAKAQHHYQQTGQLTVIVFDNASVHRSKLSQQQQQGWQQQGLLLFFLPPYSPQMNRIEDEWLHLKRDELASRVFDDEVDLADAIIEGIENRGKNGGYSVERFRFN